MVAGWPEGVDPAQQHDTYQFHPFFSENASAVPHERFIEFDNRRMLARAAWTHYFNDVDLFLCPVNLTPAFPHDTRPFDQPTITSGQCERPYVDQVLLDVARDLDRIPAAVAPVGRTPGGLPVGVQIIGPPYEDDTAITFAKMARRRHRRIRTPAGLTIGGRCRIECAASPRAMTGSPRCSYRAERGSTHRRRVGGFCPARR